MNRRKLDRNMNIRKNAKGFTLVELIVVLVIIAILAALVIPLLFGFIDNAHKKQVIARAETALSSTQAALSDIYSSNDNKYTVAKREQTRINAGSVSGDQTEFTVWNVIPLYDEEDENGSFVATKAIVEEIGSYTVGKAIYKDYEEEYAAYNGSEWQVFDSRESAEDFIAMAEINTDSIIHVWPYDKDTALMDDRIKEPPAGEDEDTPDLMETKIVKLKVDNKKMFYSGSKTGYEHSDQDEIPIRISKSEDNVFFYDWSYDDNEKRFTYNTFTTLWLRAALTYRFRYWQEVGDEDVTKNNLTQIANYVFDNDKDDCVFLAVAERDPNAKEQATLGNAEFKSFLKSGNITGNITSMVQVPDEGFTEAEISSTYGAVKVDDGEYDITDDQGNLVDYYVIYAWYDSSDNSLKWWTNALVAFLPVDCSSMLSGLGNDRMKTCSFEGFDARKVQSMESMASGNEGLTSIDFGSNFAAPELTNLKACFKGAKQLASIDMSKITELSSSGLQIEEAFRSASSLKTVKFGDAFKKTHITDTMKYLFFEDSVLEGVDMSGWHVENVDSLERAFYNCQSMKLNEYSFKGWDLQNCTSMLYAFYGCGENHMNNGVPHDTDLHDFKVGPQLKNIAECFKNSAFQTLVLNNVNVSNVDNMRSTFSGCALLTDLNIDSWKPNNVKNLRETFKDCKKLTSLNLSGWKMKDLEILYETFMDCTNLTTLNLDGWKENGPVSGATLRSVQEAFCGCSNLTGTIDFSGWNTSNLVKDYIMDKEAGEYSNNNWYKVNGPIKDMFKGCKKLENIYLKGWNLTNVQDDMGAIFNGCSSLKQIDLSNWQVGQGARNFKSTFLKDSKNTLESVSLNSASFKYFTSLDDLLSGCKKLTKVDVKGLNAENALSASAMFKDCALLTEVDLTGAIMGNVKDITAMFSGCSKLETIKWTDDRFGKLSSIADLFNGCRSLLNINIEGLDMSAVTAAKNLFKDCSSVQTIDMSDINLKLVEDLSGLFMGCSSLTTLDLSGVNTSSATNISNMFNGCAKLASIDMSNMDISKVSDMSGLFQGCAELMTFSFNKADASSVTNISNMFNGCAKLTSISLKGMNLSKVGDFSGLFMGCTALTTVDLEGLNMSSATKMSNMFNGCSKLTSIDMSNMDISKVSDMSGLFQGCSELTTLELNDIDASSVTKISNLFKGCSKLANVDMSNMDLSKVSDISGLFQGCAELTTVNLNKAKVSSAKKISNMFNGCVKLASVNLKEMDLAKAEDFSNLFKGCAALTTLDLEGVDTSSAKNMSNMFNGCSKVTDLDLSGFNMENVTNIGSMISGMTSLENISISGWKLKNVRFPADSFFRGSGTNSNLKTVDMSNVELSDTTSSLSKMLFESKKLITVSMNGLKAGEVTTFDNIFTRCDKLTTVKMNNVDAPKVTNLTSLFKGCSSLGTFELDGINLPNVKIMDQMFSGCKKLTTIDLTNIGMSNLENTNSMFYQCSTITEITLGRDCSSENLTVFSNMFRDCNKLITIRVYNKNFDLSAVGKVENSFFSNDKLLVGGASSNPTKAASVPDYYKSKYACVDEGTAKPGFFTLIQ